MNHRLIAALVAASTLTPALTISIPAAAQDAPKTGVATAFFGADYLLKRTGIPQDRVTWKYDGAGHMIYIRAVIRAR